MAGVYPDIPGTRFALDKDGSIMKWRDFSTGSAWQDVSSSIVNTQTITTATYIDAPVASYGGKTEFAVAFPEARSIAGVYVHPGDAQSNYDASSPSWTYSTDTTDGTDGNWTSFSAGFTYYNSHHAVNQSSKPYYRSDIAPLSLTGVKGIRFNFSTGYKNPRLYIFQLYGSRPLSGIDRLAFWDPTLDQQIAPAALDFGDIPQGSSKTLEVRVKNTSANLKASNASVKISDIKPEYDNGNMQLSFDNTTFTGSLNLGDLAPGAISPIVYVKRTVPSTQDTGLRFARLIADATSWA